MTSSYFINSYRTRQSTSSHWYGRAALALVLVTADAFVHLNVAAAQPRLHAPPTIFHAIPSQPVIPFSYAQPPLHLPPHFRSEPLRIPAPSDLPNLSLYLLDSSTFSASAINSERFAEELKPRKEALKRGDVLYASPGGIRSGDEAFSDVAKDLEALEREVTERKQVDPQSVARLSAKLRESILIAQFQRVKTNTEDALQQTKDLRKELDELKAAKENETTKREALRGDLLEKINDLYKWVIGGCIGVVLSLLGVGRTMLRGKPSRRIAQELPSAVPAPPAEPKQRSRGKGRKVA